MSPSVDDSTLQRVLDLNVKQAEVLTRLETQMAGIREEQQNQRVGRHELGNRLQVQELELTKQRGDINTLRERADAQSNLLSQIKDGLDAIVRRLDNPNTRIHLDVPEVLWVRSQMNTERVRAEEGIKAHVTQRIAIAGLIAGPVITIVLHFWR